MEASVSVLRMWLAIGAGVVFMIGVITFAIAFTSYRAQSCLSQAEVAANHTCTEATTTMQMSALIAMSMVAVMWILIRRARAGHE